MNLIGLTGGIASGKSTVCSWLQRYKIQTISADQIYHNFLQSKGIQYWIVRLSFYGKYPDILTPDGSIDRRVLGRIVFNDQIEMRRLMARTHPFIILGLIIEVIKCYLGGENLLVLDIPLLFEIGINRFVSKTVVVFSPEGTSIQRLLARGLDRSDINRRIGAQIQIETKKRLADIVIDNSGTWKETEKQLEKIFLPLANPPRIYIRVQRFVAIIIILSAILKIVYRCFRQ